MNDTQLTLQAGDEALVFRLKPEPGTPRVAQLLKGKIGAANLLKMAEIGLLKRVS